MVINFTLKSGEQIFVKIQPEQMELLKKKLEDFKNGESLDLSEFEVMKQDLEQDKGMP